MKAWDMVVRLNKIFWELYFKSAEVVDEATWRWILRQCGFDYIEQELESHNEIVEIGTPMGERKALIATREGCTVIITEGDEIFSGWANREGLSEEEERDALRKMLDLIVFSLSYIFKLRGGVDGEGCEI